MNDPYLDFYRTPPRRMIINPYSFGGAVGPVLIAHTGKGGGSGGVTTDAIVTTGANFLVASAAWGGGNSGTLTDSKGNTWTPLAEQQQGTVKNQLWYCFPTSVGSGHTFDFAGDSLFASMEVAAFSGVVSYDTQTGFGASTWTTIAPGPLTPGQSNVLSIVGLVADIAATLSIDNGYTITDQVPFSGGSYYGGAMAYKVVTNGAAQNPLWTASTTVNEGVARIATFNF